MMSATANRSSASGFVSDERTEDGLLKVHGIALGENDITHGSLSGERKLWRPEVLQEAGDLLAGKDIVADHENQSAYKTIGRVTDSAYKPGMGIIYQGVIQDDELEPKIEQGWLDVSPRLMHSKEADKVSEGVKAPKEIFDLSNLSVVRQGASHSNELNVGDHEELSVEELQEAFDDIDKEDSVIEYHSHIEEGSDEENEELQEDKGKGLRRWMYSDQNGARGAAETFGCNSTHSHSIEGDKWFMPCENHDEFLRKLAQKRLREASSDEEMEEAEESQVSEDETPESNESEVEENQEVDESVEDDNDEPEEVDELSASEKKRIAGQMSSWSRLKREEAMDLLEAVDPDGSLKDMGPFANIISSVFDDVDQEEVRETLDGLIDKPENSSDSSAGQVLRRMFR